MELFVVGLDEEFLGATAVVVFDISSHFTQFLRRVTVLRDCDHCHTKEMLFDEFTTVGDNPSLLLCGHCKAIWGPRNAYQQHHKDD